MRGHRTLFLLAGRREWGAIFAAIPKQVPRVCPDLRISRQQLSHALRPQVASPHQSTTLRAITSAATSRFRMGTDSSTACISELRPGPKMTVGVLAYLIR